MISLITPSEPNDTRPACQTSAFDAREQSSTWPSAVTRRNAFTSADRTAELRARAVRAGADRAGDRLPVDIALVLEADAARRTAAAPARGSCFPPRTVAVNAFASVADDALKVVERDQRAVASRRAP